MKLPPTQTQSILDNITQSVMKSDAIPSLHKGAFIQILFDKIIRTLIQSKVSIPDLEVYVKNQTHQAISEYKRLVKNPPSITVPNRSRKTEIEQFVSKNLIGQHIRQKRIEQYSHSKHKSR